MTKIHLSRTPLRWQLWPAGLLLALFAALALHQTSPAAIVADSRLRVTSTMDVRFPVPSSTMASPETPQPTASAIVVSVDRSSPSAEATLTPGSPTPTLAPTVVATPEPVVTPLPTKDPQAVADSSEAIVPARSTPAPSSGSIALTFDCGYGAASLTRILQTLAVHQVHATFFLEGYWVARSPHIVPLIVAGGHEIGSHSYSHPDFTTLTELEVTSELTNTEAAIAQAGGPTSLSLFRYPYGAHNAETDVWISARGYTPVGWSIDPKGWHRATIAEDVVTHVRTHAKPGGIVLMHCGSAADEGALDQVLTDLHSQGYRLVTVSELL